MTDKEFEEREDYYRFLEALRRDGTTNMYGAGPYLQEVFGSSRSESNAILVDWMKNYSEIHDRIYK